MVFPTQEEITNHLTILATKTFDEAIILANKHGPWISDAITTWSSAAPPWVFDLLDQSILRFTIGDDFDSFRAVNTAIALLTAWMYYRTFRVIFSIVRFWLRTILGICWVVRSTLGSFYGLLYSIGLWCLSLFSSGDKQTPSGNHEQAPPASPREQRGAPPIPSSQSGFLNHPVLLPQWSDQMTMGDQMAMASINTAVPAMVPTTIGLQHPIPVLPPAFSPQSQQQEQTMLAERVGSSPSKRQQTPKSWVEPLPPRVLRYNNNVGAMASPFVPIGSYATRPSVPQQISSANAFTNPSPLRQTPVDLADANTADKTNPKKGETRCVDSENESDHDGHFNEADCLRAMLAPNNRKNSAHKNGVAIRAPIVQKPMVIRSASTGTTTKEQVNKRKRGGTQSETENMEPSLKSKKQRIAKARANAKKWANETFGNK